MALSCNARDDCISVSQLWVLLSFPLLKSAAECVERTEQLKERVRAGTQLRLMLTRQLLLYLPFPSLRELHDGETVRALQEEVETITINTVDESVSQAEVMGPFLLRERPHGDSAVLRGRDAVIGHTVLGQQREEADQGE